MNLIGVMRQMFFLIPAKDQIGDAIVGPASVNVMDYFSRKKKSAKMLLHKQTMLVHVAISRRMWMFVGPDAHVPVMHGPAVFKSRVGTSTSSEKFVITGFASFSDLGFILASFFPAIAAILNLFGSYFDSCRHGHKMDRCGN